jgi:hypothetical protein
VLSWFSRFTKQHLAQQEESLRMDFEKKQKTSAALLRQHADLLNNIQRDVKTFRQIFRSLQAHNPVVNEHLSETHHLLLEIEGRFCTLSDLLHSAARKAERVIEGK